MSPGSLSEIAGVQLRHLRKASGRTTEAVAAAARRLGFDWTSMTVAHIETGKRKLSIEEFVLLPSILSLGLEQSVGFDDVIPDQAQVCIASGEAGLGSISGRKLRDALGGRVVTDVRLELVRNLDPRITGLLPAATTTADAGQAVRDARGEAELAAARKLGFDPVQVAHAARACWGRTLSEERESRLENQDGGATPRQMQAKRGHVTRQLLADLTVYLSNYPRSADGER